MLYHLQIRGRKGGEEGLRFIREMSGCVTQISID
jgi:hypothetical protein